MQKEERVSRLSAAGVPASPDLVDHLRSERPIIAECGVKTIQLSIFEENLDLLDLGDRGFLN